MDMLHVSASEAYKALIKDISAFLKEMGFSRRGDCFHLRRHSNWGLLDFQKSRKSTIDEVIFTVNLGVCSQKLLKFFSPESLAERPSIEVCQWRQRLGFLLPDPQDRWWTIRSNEPLKALADELKGHLSQTAIPTIERTLSDEQLRREWLAGRSPGLTDLQRLINVSVLLKALGEENTLGEVLEELRAKSAGKPAAAMVKQHLQLLQSSRSK